MKIAIKYKDDLGEVEEKEYKNVTISYDFAERKVIITDVDFGVRNMHKNTYDLEKILYIEIGDEVTSKGLDNTVRGRMAWNDNWY